MPDETPSPPTPRSASFLRGVRLGAPIFLGYMPVGAAFGVLSRTVGLTTGQAAACSATVLAGAGQFIALSLMRTGVGALAVIAATTIVNLRYVLFGATVSPHLRDTPVWRQVWLGFSLTDETFAVNITDLRKRHADATSMAGVGAVAWAGWVLGTTLGALGAGLIGDPSAWGVEFAMPAMFTALLVAQAEDQRHVVIGVLAAVLAVALAPILPDMWFVVVAAVIAATFASVVYR